MTDSKPAKGCRLAIHDLQAVMPEMAAVDPAVCDEKAAALATLAQNDQCSTLSARDAASEFAACFVGVERERFINLVAGQPPHVAPSSTNYQTILQALRKIKTPKDVQSMAARVHTGEVPLTALLDIGLGQGRHLHISQIYDVLLAAGPQGDHVLRLIMRHGHRYSNTNDLEAARALVQHSGDTAAIMMLSRAAMSSGPLPGRMSVLWYGRTLFAMQYLVGAGKRVKTELLARIAVHAPIFTAPDSPAAEMEEGKRRMIGPNAAPRKSARAEFVEKILARDNGRTIFGRVLQKALTGYDRRIRRSAQALLKELPVLKKSLPAPAK